MTSTNKILQVVTDFLKVHDQLTGKYWPMVDVFVERLARGIPERKIAADFHQAYRQAKGLKREDQLPWYWYKIVNDVQHVALKGRVWIDEHRAKGFGFWKLLELAAFVPLEKKRRGSSKSTVLDELATKNINYFVRQRPNLFPVLCAAFFQEGKLPDIAREQKQEHVYERLCVRMLNILLNDATFFFDPKHNWPDICERILNQIKPSQFPVILDIETNQDREDA